MPKPRKLANVSEELTTLLNIDGIKAVGGDQYNIIAMSPDTAVPVCIECGGPVVNHGKFERILLDIVTENTIKRFAHLHFCFYKYRCLSTECGAVFQKKIAFVKDNAKTTKRYEDEVMSYALYESFDKVRSDMNYLGIII